MNLKTNSKPEPDFTMALGSNGLTTAGTFFLILSLIFIGFLSYAFVVMIKNMEVINTQVLSAFTIVGIVLIANIILFLVTYSLSFEVQRITISQGQVLIKKIRPLWPGINKTVNLDQVEGFVVEKLGFNFMNVWYAFLFHKDFGADEVENFISPHVRLSDHRISFFEYADDSSKKKVIEGLKSKDGISKTKELS